MSYTFRSAAPTDWEQVAQLLTRVELPLDGAQEHLADFVLAVDGEQLAGVAAVEQYAEHGLLRSVAVAQRGQGLGQTLVRHILAQARAEGLQDITLLTTTAADFFPRFGFEKIAREQTPAAVQTSIEIQEACPASATVMFLKL
ncbi:MAG: arsenic resistance N-acetyltransferase ArsN2 [Anaerolineae bacterium]